MCGYKCQILPNSWQCLQQQLKLNCETAVEHFNKTLIWPQLTWLNNTTKMPQNERFLQVNSFIVGEACSKYMQMQLKRMQNMQTIAAQ